MQDQPPRGNHALSDAELARQVDEAARATELQDLDAGLSQFDRAINAVAEVIGVAVLLMIVTVVFLNALGRYALGFGFIWGDELVLSLLPWLGMLGMFLSIRRRQIIRIDFFAHRLGARLAHLLDFATHMFAAAAFLWLAIVSLQYLQFFGADRMIYVGLQKGWFMAAMVVGPAIAAIAYLGLLAKDNFKRKRSDAE
jgi:TRAP-type C4-dicarboxylate transport system permease small subunit